MSDKIFIMNFNNECIGYIERTSNAFIQNYKGNTSAYHIRYCTKGLEYYYMNHLDVWEHLKRSNGFKSSRDIWFMAEPISEVWISLVVGMQKYSRYDNWFQINDEIKI